MSENLFRKNWSNCIKFRWRANDGSSQSRSLWRNKKPKKKVQSKLETYLWREVFEKFNKISSYEEDYRADRPMVQRASSETPSLSGNNRESSRMNIGIGYTAYQGGYNKLFTQVCAKLFLQPSNASSCITILRLTGQSNRMNNSKT